jgi:SAM-dependent methyltransferase
VCFADLLVKARSRRGCATRSVSLGLCCECGFGRSRNEVFYDVSAVPVGIWHGRMRRLDRLLQRWRMRAASSFIPSGSRLLDIGCHQGEFLQMIETRLGPSIGIDPLAKGVSSRSYMTLPLPFSEPLPFADSAFDVIALLATLEHIPDTGAVARECYRVLINGGHVIATVPSVLVDDLVGFLIKLRLADGMSLDQHFGLEPQQVPDMFQEYGFSLVHHRRFQLGLNHLMILEKSG